MYNPLLSSYIATAICQFLAMPFITWQAMGAYSLRILAYLIPQLVSLLSITIIFFSVIKCSSVLNYP